MKVRSLLFSMLCVLTLGAVVVSCDDDDEQICNGECSKVQLPENRTFILNQGVWEKNNAGIAFYAPDKNAETIGDIYFLQNGQQLGDNAQDLIEYEDKLYVAVNGSNYLAKLNTAGVEEKRISFVGDKELGAGIRYLAAEDGYIYASFYNGYVAKINANTLIVEGKLGGLGDNLEGIAECNDTLYIANSYKTGEQGNYNYQNELVKVNLHSFTKEGVIIVDMNPNRIFEEDGNLVLLSLGDYGNEPNSLQVIDPVTGKIIKLGKATAMCAGNDGMIYYVNSETQDYTHYTNTFYQYNLRTGGKPQELKLQTTLPNVQAMMMSFDEDRNELYVGFADFTSTGDVYRFRTDGTLVDKFDCGGINPFAAVFID